MHKTYPQKSPSFPNETLSVKPNACGLLSTAVKAAFESQSHVLTCQSKYDVRRARVARWQCGDIRRCCCPGRR